MELNRQNVRRLYHEHYADARERMNMSEGKNYLTERRAEEIYLECVTADEDGADWEEELKEIAFQQAEDDGDYNFWEDFRERID
ncbi:MAG: hypothetical protein WCS15_04650 [Prevotella sp.]